MATSLATKMCYHDHSTRGCSVPIGCEGVESETPVRICLLCPQCFVDLRLSETRETDTYVQRQRCMPLYFRTFTSKE
ncbi:hypothetical protein NDU88_002362 [Pleurodeles waltl]|uniref:Uncharacterized protein n=1 Tax=Pleurodeles waltl TaxID=8319 RepID=A0AAV7P9Q5_PLEWA|nr:hypothetical protein NDU88_002362 [Pleurodeles waltl]